MLRRVITYHLAFLLLLTNIGVPVFTHICYGHGTSWSSVLLPARSCCSQPKGQADDDKGCQKGVTCCTKEVSNKPCCDNEISIVQMECDLPAPSVGDLESEYIYPSILAYHEARSSALNSIQHSFLAHAPPVLPDGKSMTLLHRVIRC